MGLRTIASSVLLLTAFGLPATIQAETIQITGGVLATSGGPSGSGTLSLEGERGFTFTAGFGLPFVFFAPSFCDPSCGAPAGTTLGINATLVGNDLHGTATLDGTTYLNVGSVALNESMFVQLSGSPLPLPEPTGSSTITLLAPFTMTGIFFYGLTSVDLAGSGMAAITLAALGSSLTANSGPWQFQSASYDFVPVPEPGTLSLLLLGAAGLAKRRRRATRRSSGR